MQPDASQKVLNLPNSLTALRLACIPLVIVLLHYAGPRASVAAAILFVLACVTDILDGYFARRYNAVTILGKFLDPLADKVLISGTMIMLIPLGRIPAWIVVVIISRELLITGLRGIAVAAGVVIPASALGKYKTIAQATALTLLCLHYDWGPIPIHATGMVCLWIALVLTIWSGWDYFKRSKRILLGAQAQH